MTNKDQKKGGICQFLSGLVTFCSVLVAKKTRKAHSGPVFGSRTGNGSKVFTSMFEEQLLTFSAKSSKHVDCYAWAWGRGVAGLFRPSWKYLQTLLPEEKAQGRVLADQPSSPHLKPNFAFFCWNPLRVTVPQPIIPCSAFFSCIFIWKLHYSQMLTSSTF